MDYRLVAPPRATALRFLSTSLALCTLLGCAGKGGSAATGGTKGAGGSSAAGGATGSGGATGTGGSGASGGSTGSGGTGSGGTASSGGATGAGGTVATGGTTGAAGATGAGGSTGSGGTGAGGTTGTGGNTGAGGDVSIGDGGTDAACQTADFKFVPQIPTVYLLVDRSGSMFDCLDTGSADCANMANTSWSTLKGAIESVIKTLDSQVRFGFTTVWGTNPAGSGGMCPSLQGTLTDDVAPALNNAATITAKYDALPFPGPSTAPGMKFESPASESIANTATALQAVTDPGPKYIIFLTDGQPDYCDDSLALCAIDSVVYHLQLASAAGIHTIVFGLQSTHYDLPAGTLQAFANAGAGEPTIAPVTSGEDVNAFFDQCGNGNVAGWLADLTASGKPKTRGTSLGTYMSTMGPTKPYTPSASDQTQLTTQLSMALSGVKSCSFDLSDVNGKSIKVDTTMLGKASVKIQGTTIPQNATNGWSMSGPTTLVLNGSACTTWQTPNNNDISFAFPCSTIIFE